MYLGDRDQKLPSTYTLIEIEVPAEMAARELSSPSPDWREKPALTRAMGESWLTSLETPLARVPSAIVPRTWNYLLNPEHGDAAQVKIVSVIREAFDMRLFQRGAY